MGEISMKIRKVSCIFLAALFMVFVPCSFVSCNDSDDETESEQSQKAPPPQKFQYEHNPSLNPLVLRDAIEDETAVYGYSPNPESGRLTAYATSAGIYDWSDPEKVKEYRQRRIEYHEANDTIDVLIIELTKEGKSIEEIARAAVAQRNLNRLNDYIKNNDYDGLMAAMKSNLEKYGNEYGLSAEAAFEKYGNWETVIEKSKSANAGMDACCGLYDIYYYLYPVENQ